MPNLKDSTAIVTGAARGIGKASAQALAEAGASVVLTDVSIEEGEATAAAIRSAGGKACFAYQDVTAETEWEKLFEHVLEKLGAVNVLVNNAGIAELGSIEDTSFDQWQRVMAVKSDAVFLGTRAAVRHMKNHGGGSIVNVSSIEGMVGSPILTAYNASKGAVRLLTKSAALHCAREGYQIRVNSIHPGFTETSLVTDAIPLAPEGFADAVLADTPLNRFAKPEEIAKGILFLASDDSSYMTGSELITDGGFTAR
ncbi:MAG: glucose 1-dehydrogenase [Pseudomonadota bacterium]